MLSNTVIFLYYKCDVCRKKHTVGFPYKLQCLVAYMSQAQLIRNNRPTMNNVPTGQLQ